LTAEQLHTDDILSVSARGSVSTKTHQLTRQTALGAATIDQQDHIVRVQILSPSSCLAINYHYRIRWRWCPFSVIITALRVLNEKSKALFEKDLYQMDYLIVILGIQCITTPIILLPLQVLEYQCLSTTHW
jgi:hypothetical protein